jgi:hypothetical protein
LAPIPVKAVYNFFNRIIPERIKNFHFKINDNSNNKDELEASDGKVNLSGNSPIPLKSGT